MQIGSQQRNTSLPSTEGDINQELTSVNLALVDLETYITNLESRLSCVLAHQLEAKAAGGPSPVPPCSSELHGRLVSTKETAQMLISRVLNITNRVTL